MTGVLTITKRYKSLAHKAYHYLFQCPTFWSMKPKFTCPVCGKGFRCYWDGNDCHGMIDVCKSCAKELGEERK